MYRLLCVFLLSFLASCASTAKTQNIVTGTDGSENIGWLHGGCLAIKNPGVAQQDTLTLVLLDEPQSVIKVKVIREAETGEQCYPLLQDRRQVNKDDGYSFYVIDAKEPVNLAIGILGDVVDVNQYQFDYCTTSEGVLFSVNKNEEEVWHGYYYLGYDSEATCKPTE